MVAAVNDPYASASEYRTGISPNKSDTSGDTEIDNDLLAVSRWLERRLGRFFNQDAAAVERDFVAPASGPINPEAENPWKNAGAWSPLLHLDADLVSVTAITTDEDGDNTPETTLTAAYRLLPLNAALGPEPAPYNAVQLLSGGWPSGRLVRIEGIWGWPAVPAPIKRGVINLTALLRLETPRASTTTDSMGMMTSTNREAKGIVDDLVRLYMKASF